LYSHAGQAERGSSVPVANMQFMAQKTPNLGIGV